jgi:hypothetical protein
MLLFRVVWWALRSRLTWFAAGAALMWFFDPEHGDDRRARLTGQVQDLSSAVATTDADAGGT